MSSASVAVLVKSRAKFGRRLTKKNYNDLLACKNVSDIVTYLKSNTHYSSCLDGLQEAAIHRGNVEALLKRHIYTEFANLCSFERSVGEHYFEYLLLRSEVDQLLVFLRYFYAGKPNEYPFSLPDFFKKSSKIDVSALTHACSFDEILNILKHTRFYKLLVPFKPQNPDEMPDFTFIESALDRYVYANTQKLIEKDFIGNTEKELKTILEAQAELDNIRKIYRAKKYYDDTTIDEIKVMLNDLNLYLSKRKLNDMVCSQSADDVLLMLKKTRYRHSMKSEDAFQIDDFARRFLYSYCRKKMRFSREPAVVMASTIILFEDEINNITNIIEGKRYGVDADTIKSLLILDEQG